MCKCGCGQPAPLAPYTDRRYGYVKGQPVNYIRGHSSRKYAHGATCAVEGCSRSPESDALCHSHFEYRRRTGRLPSKPILDTDDQRFMAKVKQLPSGHWIWTGARNGDGRYGIGTVAGHQHNAHRCAWLLFRGPIPDGLVVEHLCRRTLCVNPDHLQVTTQQTNVLRGDAPSAVNAAKTHCIRGHEFTPENTVLRNGGRQCATCTRARVREAMRRWRAKQRTA